MDIIDVFTITSKATVEQWDEGSEEIKHDLYWRQAYDIRTRGLSVQTPPSLCTTYGSLTDLGFPDYPCRVQVQHPGEPRQDAPQMRREGVYGMDA